MNPGVLTRYRVMAYVTAVLLLGLVVAMVLKYLWPTGTPTQAFGDTATQYIGMLHGFLFMVYLLTALDLTVRLKIEKIRMLLVMIAGTIPFGAFVAERKMTKVYQEKLAATGSR